MMATLAEQLARRVRVAAGPHDNPDMSVQQVVSAMAARIAELESLLLEIRGECWSAIGGSGRLLLGDIAALGMRIDAALSKQGKEGEA